MKGLASASRSFELGFTTPPPLRGESEHYSCLRKLGAWVDVGVRQSERTLFNFGPYYLMLGHPCVSPLSSWKRGLGRPGRLCGKYECRRPGIWVPRKYWDSKAAFDNIRLEVSTGFVWRANWARKLATFKKRIALNSLQEFLFWLCSLMSPRHQCFIPVCSLHLA